MYQIQQQYIPGLSQIWVARLAEGDEDFIFDTEEEANIKLAELTANDTSGREYRIVYL
jgi:hypothetical protein